MKQRKWRTAVAGLTALVALTGVGAPFLHIPPAIAAAGQGRGDRDAKKIAGATRALLNELRFSKPTVARVRELLDRGANPNARVLGDDGDNLSVLMLSVYQKQQPVTALLIARGADVNARSVNGQTALSLACVFADVPTVSHLLAKGARLVQPNGGTALIDACSAVNLPVVAYLLDKKRAPLNAETKTGVTALSAACEANENIVRLPQDAPDYGDRRAAFVRSLLRKGARVNNKSGESPALLASLWSEKITRVLLQAGANPNTRDETKMTALMHVAAGDKADTDLAEPLINAGATLDLQDHDGKTALMYAAEADNAALVRLLMSRGANRSLKSRSGQDALEMAQANKAAKAVRALTDAGPTGKP